MVFETFLLNGSMKLSFLNCSELMKITFQWGESKVIWPDGDLNLQIDHDIRGYGKCPSPYVVGCLSRGLGGTSSKKLRKLNFVESFRRKVSKTMFYDKNL